MTMKIQKIYFYPYNEITNIKCNINLIRNQNYPNNYIGRNFPEVFPSIAILKQIVGNFYFKVDR